MHLPIVYHAVRGVVVFRLVEWVETGVIDRSRGTGPSIVVDNDVDHQILEITSAQHWPRAQQHMRRLRIPCHVNVKLERVL